VPLKFLGEDLREGYRPNNQLTAIYAEYRIFMMTIIGCSMGHLSDTSASLYNGHLSTEATVDCSMGHLSDTSASLYNGHLSTEATVDWPLGHFNR
jgi:hypothetical protein